jgi:hypothetical protein
MEGSSHRHGETAQVREAHGARTQALFRDVNERVKELNAAFKHVLPLGDWVCECANDRCTDRLYVSVSDYERVRSDGATFIVLPSQLHVDPEIEDIDERTDDFWVVKKHGRAADLARAVDPRKVGLRGQS